MRPLEGIRVLALEHYFAGPFGSQFLADAGAEVIKVEPPGVGDTSRTVGAIRQGERDIPVNFLRLNRNKKSIELDLKSEKGRSLFYDLAAKSDVIWENMGPGTLVRLGIGPREMMDAFPSIIYATISGFGKSVDLQGPYDDRRAFDFITQAMSGLMWLPSGGTVPQWLGFQLTDLYPGVLAALGVMFALWKRERTGQGDHVDIAMYDSAVNLNEKIVALFALTGRVPTGPGDLQMTNQIGVIETSDGHVAIGVVDDRQWSDLCDLIGRPDLGQDRNLQTRNGRTEQLETVVRPAIAAWARRTPRDVVVDALVDLGVPVGPVQQMDEVVACPQLRARDMFVSYQPSGSADDPVPPEGFLAVNNPVKLVSERGRQHASPPPLGRDTQAVLTTILGLDECEIADIQASGAIGRQPLHGEGE